MSIFIKKEALGGMLYLTNYRVIFKSHKFNRVTGTFSILLPDVQEVTNTSRFLMRKLEILIKGLDKFEFVIWGVPKTMEMINYHTKVLTLSEKQHIHGLAEEATERGNSETGLAKF